MDDIPSDKLHLYIQELDRTVSDLHKDAYGCRPSNSFWKEWDSLDPNSKIEMYDRMVSHLHSD